MAPIILIAVYTALVALAAFLTDLRVRHWSLTANRASKLRRFWLTLFILLSALPIGGAFLPNSPVKFALQGAGNIWLGFYLYFGLLLLGLLGLEHLVHRISGKRLANNWHGSILCLALVLALAVTGYGLVHAQDTVVERYEIQVDKAGEDMKLVLIGDLHLSVNSRLATTQRMVELINAEQPDAVVIAGDIFTSSYGGLAHPEQYAEALRGIQAKYGVYAVYGNHDVEETLFGGFPISPVSQAFRTAQMEQFFKDSGFTVLYDQVVDIGGVQLAGRVDGEKAGDGTTNRMTPAELLANIDPERPVVVLEHEPKEFQALKEAGADVALCGHTHAGQMFPGNLVIPFFNENAWGYAKVHDLDTVVTAGLGYYGPPMRVGTNSEVSVVNLKFKH